MHSLVILGAGGHGRETLDIVEAINEIEPAWRPLGFVDDGTVNRDRLERRHASVLGAVETMSLGPASFLSAPSAVRRTQAASGSPDPGAAHYVIGVGSSHARSELDARLTSWGWAAATLVHPLASIASDNRIDPGVLLAAGARVTTNVSLGRHVHLNVNAVVSHDCTVGHHSTLSPGVHLSGEVSLGERVFLGTGAIVNPGVAIGDDAVIASGAVVVRDVPAGVTVKGVPGRW